MSPRRKWMTCKIRQKYKNKYESKNKEGAYSEGDNATSNSSSEDMEFGEGEEEEDINIIGWRNQKERKKEERWEKIQ